MSNPGEFIAIMTVMMIGGVVVLRLTFALARRLEGKTGPQPLSPDVASRLERIEHALDSVAIEVERISEGQRFTTKVLSERSTRAQDPK